MLKGRESDATKYLMKMFVYHDCDLLIQPFTFGFCGSARGLSITINAVRSILIIISFY